ncbi:NADH:flavin oxidoreductase [Winogradskya humida]|uniref:Oxidoreductase n=1 Tax=Winogradskya humida TaxID=113566 RepID=A0ABQ3ZT34_9ACTN|nr:NADH:flavin oxidoreductase [Actinoplanes humidus]GIE21741.1 oxidoreductase [Actinoplanes humidus]
MNPLFRPYDLAGLALANRIVMAPMTRQFSPGGVPGQDVVDYYTRRAAGGVGLIVTEGTYVEHPSAGTSTRVPRFYGEDALAGWKRVVDGVHAAGGRIVPQLWHVGATRKAGRGPVPEAPVTGPSGLDLDGAELPGPDAVLSLSDVDDIIGAFAGAAKAARAAGFDGVELHGAHGYLIDQFLWERTNRRTDEYGGDPVSRAKFAAEVTAAVRAAVGPDFPVIFRMSQWKSGAYDAQLAEDPQTLERVLTPLIEAGADAFHASQRRFWQPEFEGSELNLAGWIKKLTGHPVITVGSVGLDVVFTDSLAGQGQPSRTEIQPLLERLERDEFDLVAIGRSLIADPEWPNKVRDGRFDEIKAYENGMLKELY